MKSDTQPEEAPAPLATDPKRFRRLKANEIVNVGDFVSDGKEGFERWEGPGGFRSDAFLKPIFRQDRKISPATSGIPQS